MDVVVAEDGKITVSFSGNDISGSVDDDGVIAFDSNPQSFQTGQIAENSIHAVGSSTVNTIETRTTLTPTFPGTLPKVTRQPVSQTAGPGDTVI